MSHEISDCPHNNSAINTKFKKLWQSCVEVKKAEEAKIEEVSKGEEIGEEVHIQVQQERSPNLSQNTK